MFSTCLLQSAVFTNSSVVQCSCLIFHTAGYCQPQLSEGMYSVYIYNLQTMSNYLIQAKYLKLKSHDLHAGSLWWTHIIFILYRKTRPQTLLIPSLGTSGDTGGSAIQNARGLSGLDIMVIYPHGRITSVQEKHMITCVEDNIHVFAGEDEEALWHWPLHKASCWQFFYGLASAADGSSDDIDQPLRHLFADQELVKSSGLMSLNSVNMSRVLIQLAHFIYAYLELSGMEQFKDNGELPELEVVVPTGGAGNIAGEIDTACRTAKQWLLSPELLLVGLWVWFYSMW